MTEGILLVDKPAGITSYDVIRKAKKAFNISKIGHGGTLDPFATGLLVVLIGRKYTRLQPKVMLGEKVYQARLRIGVETNTGDLTGNITGKWTRELPGIDEIRAALHAFVGDIQQKPHPFSAVKHHGRPLYYYARQGIDIPIPSRQVSLYELSIGDWAPPDLDVKMRVSKGFYVRTLAMDLGIKLGTGAVVAELRRMSVGRFLVQDAVQVDMVQRDNPDLLSHVIQVETTDVSFV